LLLIVSTASSQTGTAAVVGEVVDAQGAVAAGAKVTITSLATGAERSTTTDATGNYQFLSLSPGQYKLKVELDGFRAAIREKVELLVNTSSRVNFSLEVGTVTETVVVNEASTTLNTTDASLGNVIENKFVNSLPLEGRNPAMLLTLQSGVAFSGDFSDMRSGSVSGARSDQSNLTLDGVSINDQQTQDVFAAALPVPVESIQEFRFTTSNPGAEMGRSSGGQVGFVTKSGSNEFHGSAFWYHRNTVTTANDFFNNLNGIDTPKLIRNQYGGSLGGPILKERLFFFGTYEGTKRREEVNVGRNVFTDNMRDGVLIYQCATPAACPGGTVNGLTGTHTIAPGDMGLSPADLLAVDPASIGVNMNMISLIQSYPRCNATGGQDGGLSDSERNFCGFVFNAPFAGNQNIWVSRIDFNITRDARHTLYWRGTLNDLSQDLTPQQFPGLPVAQQNLDNSKGMGIGYTALIGQNKTSTFRYGFTRQGFENSGQVGDGFIVRSYSNPFSQQRALIRNVPEHNLAEDFGWSIGRHTVQFGTNLRIIRNNRNSFANAFSSFSINDGFCAGLCNGILTSLTNAGFPAAASANPFKRATMALYGTITTFATAAFFDGSSNVLASGQGGARTFAYNEFEYYVQDTWRWTRDLTLTVGLRYNDYGVPYETHGLQTGTTVNVADFLAARVAAMQSGQPSASVAPLSWDLIGSENNAPGYYPSDRNNFAPNVSFAYSPSFTNGWMNRIFGEPGKSVVRGGFRVVFDRIGGSLVVSQDLNGAVGLVSQLSNRTGLLNFSGPACTTPPSVACMAPRFTGLGSLPNIANFVTVPAAGFPATPASTIANRGFVVDNTLRTPYSYAIQFSYGRELPGNMTLEVSYAGRLGQKLLAKADIAAPLIYLQDPASGQTFAEAINLLYQVSNQGAVPVASLTTTIPYFENLFSQIATTCGTNPAQTPTQSFYQFARGAFPSFTDSLLNLEGCADLAFPTFFQQQFDSLPAWTNFGRSNYHGLQATLRKRVSHGLTFDLNYTWSKSSDNASTIENAARLTGQIADVFNKQNAYSLSGFDLQHQLTANWVYELPLGRGQRFGSTLPAALEHIIGGWQTSGIFRWRGGFPLSPGNGFNFPTNFFLTGPGTWTCPVRTNLKKNITDGTSNFGPNLFGGDLADATAAFQCLGFTPSGESGSRNTIRGARFTNVDFALRKSIRMPFEGHALRFDWQVFNLFNHPNFDDRTMALNPEGAIDQFGTYKNTIGQDLRGNNARVMQFSLRYEF
jgi:hypothetical protein